MKDIYEKTYAHVFKTDRTLVKQIDDVINFPLLIEIQEDLRATVEDTAEIDDLIKESCDVEMR